MNKLRVILSAIFAIMLSSSVIAQEGNDRFFMAFHTATYIDFVSSPLRNEQTWTGNRRVDGSKIYADAPVQSSNLNIFSFGLEPRYNLKEFDDNSALAISAPFSLGLGQSGPSNNKVLGVSGIGAFQLPIMAKLYIGSGSTYKSEKDYGISFGGGLEFNKIGLIQMDEQSTSTPANKGWVVPVTMLGIHFWRGYNPMEINIKYGAGPVNTYYVDKYGNPLKDDLDNATEGRAKSRTFRISISYLLNY